MSRAFHVTGELTDSQHLTLDVPVPLPNGKVRVAVEEFSGGAEAGETQLGVRDDDLPDTPEAIESWIRWYNGLEPVEFTDAERAAWDAARQEQKEFELAQWDKRSQRLEEHFR